MRPSSLKQIRQQKGWIQVGLNRAVALGVPADTLLDFDAATRGLELLTASALTPIVEKAG